MFNLEGFNRYNVERVKEWSYRKKYDFVYDNFIDYSERYDRICDSVKESMESLNGIELDSNGVNKLCTVIDEFNLNMKIMNQSVKSIRDNIEMIHSHDNESNSLLNRCVDYIDCVRKSLKILEKDVVILKNLVKKDSLENKLNAYLERY